MELQLLKLRPRHGVDIDSGTTDTTGQDATGVMSITGEVIAVGNKRLQQLSSVIKLTGKFKTPGEQDGERMVSSSMQFWMEVEPVTSTLISTMSQLQASEG